MCVITVQFIHSNSFIIACSHTSIYNEGNERTHEM